MTLARLVSQTGASTTVLYKDLPFLKNTHRIQYAMPVAAGRRRRGTTYKTYRPSINPTDRRPTNRASSIGRIIHVKSEPTMVYR